MSKPVQRADTAYENPIVRCDIGQFVLGIDISKAYFDVYLIGGVEPASGRFDNEGGGFKQLSKWLKKRKIKTMKACMEATGRYGDALALWLLCSSEVFGGHETSFGCGRASRRAAHLLCGETAVHNKHNPPMNTPFTVKNSRFTINSAVSPQHLKPQDGRKLSVFYTGKQRGNQCLDRCTAPVSYGYYGSIVARSETGHSTS